MISHIYHHYHKRNQNPNPLPLIITAEDFQIFNHPLHFHRHLFQQKSLDQVYVLQVSALATGPLIRLFRLFHVIRVEGQDIAHLGGVFQTTSREFLHQQINIHFRGPRNFHQNIVPRIPRIANLNFRLLHRYHTKNLKDVQLDAVRASVDGTENHSRNLANQHHSENLSSVQLDAVHVLVAKTTTDGDRVNHRSRYHPNHCPLSTHPMAVQQVGGCLSILTVTTASYGGQLQERVQLKMPSNHNSSRIGFKLVPVK